MAVDLEQYAFSFSHAIIKLDDTQFTAISNVAFSQAIERSGVFGTKRTPLKKSAGQVGLGEGTITFSDLEEAMQFYASLGDEASLAVFAIDITFSNEAGDTRSFECIGCSLTEMSGDFAAGADAMGLDYPYDFLRLKVDGKEFAR